VFRFGIFIIIILLPRRGGGVVSSGFTGIIVYNVWMVLRLETWIGFICFTRLLYYGSLLGRWFY
jgi:hypothetical protein